MTNRLIPFCQRAGMTQQDLARHVGVTPSWLSRIGTGRAEFSERTERRIIRALNLSHYEANYVFRFPGMKADINGEGSERGLPDNVIEFPGNR